jgi:putative colanic acid biosynthesis acetyltransferase WcaF
VKDLINYKEPKNDLILRSLWMLINSTLFRVKLPKFYLARNLFLKLFGAHIPWHCNIYPSVDIYAPWNLALGEYVTIGPRCRIYNKAMLHVGRNTTISQDSHICSASHDSRYSLMPLTLKPVVIGERVWIASGAFIGPGVQIGDGAVVSATSSVFKSVSAYKIVRGNPAVEVADRKLLD